MRQFKIDLFLFIGAVITIFFSLPSVSSTLEIKSTYLENKKAFLNSITEKTQKLWTVSTESWPTSQDPQLTTDLIYFKNPNTASKNVLVISSGLHGIEGYIGSAIQRDLIANFVTENKIPADIVFIHALNPWGMHNNRRVDENNIDLNRNFSALPDLYQQQNPSYQEISHFLNPQKKIDVGLFHRLGFIFDSVQLILTHSLESLRQSILKGQYQENKGLYYGGRHPQPLQDRIQHFVTDKLASYQNILWIDLHTGYGEKGKLHLLSNESNPTVMKHLSRFFPSFQIDYGHNKNFYKTTGDLTSFLIAQSTPQQNIAALAFEYGTLNSQTTLGSIESLRRMVMENQMFQFGFENSESQKITQELFKSLFFPEDNEWLEKITQQTHAALSDLHFDTNP